MEDTEAKNTTTSATSPFSPSPTPTFHSASDSGLALPPGLRLRRQPSRSSSPRNRPFRRSTWSRWWSTIPYRFTRESEYL